MIPIERVQQIIDTYESLEKELASGKIDKKDFAKKSKEYASVGEIIKDAREYLSYEKEKKDLKKIIEEKSSDKDMITLAENELIQLSKKREEYIKRLNKGMEKINYRNKTGLKTEIEENIPLDKTRETVLENIIKNREKDVLFNKTSVGPHTDKIEYVINGKSVKTMASQGEKNMFFSIF